MRELILHTPLNYFADFLTIMSFTVKLEISFQCNFEYEFKRSLLEFKAKPLVRPPRPLLLNKDLGSTLLGKVELIEIMNINPRRPKSETLYS